MIIAFATEPTNAAVPMPKADRLMKFRLLFVS
jgi:hypothetical protein